MWYFKTQTKEQTKMLERKNKDEAETYKLKKRTTDLLPDASNNIAKLEVSNLRIRNYLA